MYFKPWHLGVVDFQEQDALLLERCVMMLGLEYQNGFAYNWCCPSYFRCAAGVLTRMQVR